VVSSALETSIGISMGLHLAAAIPTLDYDCGLATASLLTADITSTPFAVEAGSLVVRRVTPDAALLEQHAASVERTSWWLARLERCYGLLAARA
jgi:O-succinylbenzoate synthase